MTRINVGIRPQELSNKHLLAEHREIKRIPNNIRKGRYDISRIPSVFKLGTGHVSFFYDKLLYLRKRYEELYSECKQRGFNVEYYGSAWEGTPEILWQDYLPSKEDRKLIQDRIAEKARK